MTLALGVQLYAILTVFYISILLHASCTSSERLVVRNLANSISRRTDCPTNTCGGACGRCAADECCSEKGWCGKSKEHCAAPECKIDFGPGCDANKAPSGMSTMGTTRAKFANGIPYGGVGIFHCTVPGTVAITYDDGPSEYSTKVLDLFDQYNGKATFFINGNNKGRGMIDDPNTGWPAIIQRMYKQGHQVASHTWSHQSLDIINGQQRQAQMVYNEIALGNILGRYPTYMRPPYSQCASECQSLMADLGYHIVNFDVDIEDAINHPDLQASINDFSGNLTSKSDPASDNLLVIGHETSPDTVNKITEMMLKSINSRGFKAVTVGECLDDPKSNWYRHLDGSLDPAPSPQPKMTPTKPSISTSPPTLAATSSTTTTYGAKGPESAVFLAQSASANTKTAESSSVSQTHPAIATKSPSLSPSTTSLSSSTSTDKPGAAKSSSPATVLLDNGRSFFIVIFMRMLVNCVIQIL